jgi:hypothetical protein
MIGRSIVKLVGICLVLLTPTPVLAEQWNICADPTMAKSIMDALTTVYYVDRLAGLNLLIADLENITTTENDPSDLKLSCHFTILFSDNERTSGTIRLFRNAAGSAATTWMTDAQLSEQIYSRLLNMKPKQ